jgi:hypothetical protein
MNTPLWRHGLTLLTLVFACGGDDGAQLTSTSTTGPATEGMSSTSVGSSDGSSATSQASSSSEASTNEHTATETGCAFLDCTTTDGLPLECDIWQNNCPDGYKCMPWANDGGGSWNALKCSPIDPNPAKPGEPCTVEGNGVSGVDNCEAGAMCWNEYVPGCMTDGCCTPWCDLTDPSCPGATQQCLPWLEQGQAPPEYDTVGICGVPL